MQEREVLEGADLDGLENRTKIEHIVVLMLENRSFDQMLGYLSAGRRGRKRARRPRWDRGFGEPFAQVAALGLGRRELERLLVNASGLRGASEPATESASAAAASVRSGCRTDSQRLSGPVARAAIEGLPRSSCGVAELIGCGTSCDCGESPTQLLEQALFASTSA